MEYANFGLLSVSTDWLAQSPRQPISAHAREALYSLLCSGVQKSCFANLATYVLKTFVTVNNFASTLVFICI